MVREAIKKRGAEAMRQKGTTHQGEIDTMEGLQLRRGRKHSCGRSKREQWRKTEKGWFGKCPAACDDSAGLHNDPVGPKSSSGNCATNSK